MSPTERLLATLDDNGWTLENAAQRYDRRDELYWIPSQWEREHLDDYRVGEELYAKLIFLLRYTTADGQQAVRAERMWVEVFSREGDYYHGHLANDPQTENAAIKDGDPVWFGPQHIIDYGPLEDGRYASQGADTISCGEHGVSETCFVCEHLVGASGAGFHVAYDPDRLRPDAWCDACEQLVQQVGGDWDALGDRHPNLSILCGGCYDLTRERNMRPSTDSCDT